MGNITIAIAKGNVEDKLRPEFHNPQQIVINDEPHTIYMRKWRIPDGVEERWSRDIDAYGIHAIPALFAPHFTAYMKKTVVAVM